MFRDTFKGWVFVMFFVIITSIVFGIMGYFGKFTNTVVERKIYENSYQYSQGKKEEIATLEAQIEVLEEKLLNPKLNNETKREIRNQITALEARLRAAKKLYSNTLLK